MMSALLKNTEQVIPLSSYTVTHNGTGRRNAWYPATFLATLSQLMDRICPRSLVLPIFKSVILIFTAFPFSFTNHCSMSTASCISGIGFLSAFTFRPFFGVSSCPAPNDESDPSVSGGLRSGDPSKKKCFSMPKGKLLLS